MSFVTQGSRSNDVTAAAPRRFAHVWGALAWCLLGFLAGCNNEPPPQPPEAPKASVQHPVKRQLTESAEFNGWMEAEQTVEVRARVRGHIQKVHFKDGQDVKKGDLLFELDPRPFETSIGRAKDKVRVYEAQKVAADKDFARLSDLQKKGGASIQQVEKAEADAKALEAEISAGNNEIKRAELELKYARITADIDGVIGEAELTEGNLVNAGGSDPLLTTIRSSDPILVKFNVDERLLQRYGMERRAEAKKAEEVQAGAKDKEIPFTFRQDGQTEFSHKGVIKFRDNTIDTSTGTILVYGTVANSDRKYEPGARVRVRVSIGKPYDALLVPETAILADQAKRYVLIVDEKNQARRRDVTLGMLTDDGYRAIQPADKLAEGEKPADWWVIVDNLQRVRLNYPVDPQKPAHVTSAGK
jgi:RND family efflux transporter MFP subunit